MKQILLTMIVAAFVSFAVAYGLSSPQAGRSHSLYDRVMDSGTIRCGYMIVEPGLMKDPNTRDLSGIVYDLVEEIAKNLGLRVEWKEEYGPGELVSALENGRADMICSSIWLSAARARAVDTTDTLYLMPSTIWMPYGVPTPASFNTPDITFSALEGSTTMLLVKTLFPKAKIRPLPEMNSLAENLLVVASKKADATIMTKYPGYRFMANNPRKIRNALKEPLRSDPAVMLLPRGEMEFKNMIDNALKELHYSGYIEQLIEKYNLYEDAIVPIELP